jgi:hypothetical protein
MFSLHHSPIHSAIYRKSELGREIDAAAHKLPEDQELTIKNM